MGFRELQEIHFLESQTIWTDGRKDQPFSTPPGVRPASPKSIGVWVKARARMGLQATQLDSYIDPEKDWMQINIR